MLAAAVGLAISPLTGGDDGGAEPLGNGVAAIDPASGEVASFTESRDAAGQRRGGRGRGMGARATSARRVSRIDPETKQVTKRFRTRGRAERPRRRRGGALGRRTAGGEDITNATVSVSRLDPDIGPRHANRAAARRRRGAPVAGAPRIAVGAGAVWAANPDGSVSRIDPETGRLVATIDTDAGPSTIAAGDEGVWFIGERRTRYVGTNRPAARTAWRRRSRSAPSNLFGVAVGAGSVWAAARDEGSSGGSSPGAAPITRTIDVGVGVGFVAFGEGAIWAANYVDGVVSRIDPRTNEVTARTSVGAPQAIAAGAGSAWVSVAGGTTAGSLTVSVVRPGGLRRRRRPTC